MAELDAMNHFRKAMNQIIESKPFGFSMEVARKIDVDPGYITRLKQGTRKGMSPEVRMKLICALTDSFEERAELIVAHLKDQSCGYYPGMIEIKVRSGKRSGKAKKQ